MKKLWLILILVIGLILPIAHSPVNHIPVFTPTVAYSDTGYSDPVGDDSPLQWNRYPASDTHFSKIDDGIRQPTAGDVSDYVLKDVNNYIDTFTMSTISNVASVSNITLWAYGKAKVTAPEYVWVEGNIGLNGAWQTSTTFGFTTSASWKSISFDGNWTQADLDTFKVQTTLRCDSGIPDFGYDYAMYAVVTYTAGEITPPVTPPVTPPAATGFVFIKKKKGVYFGSTSTVSATGGTESDSGIYHIHTFTTDGTFTVANAGNVDVLVVAGAGGGGKATGQAAGGGGSGEVLYEANHAVTAQAYPVTVGDGGVGKAGGGAGNYGTGANGQQSIFDNVIADSGLGGTGGDQTSVGGNSGNGHIGATKNNLSDTGGGGGGDSADAVTDQNGAGTANSISGTSVTYGAGGLGGIIAARNGYDGAANTGNGAQGGCNQVSVLDWDGGHGGSGIVIIRYIK